LRCVTRRAIDIRQNSRAAMIARQEEMDWLVYAAYGLLPEDAPAVGLKAPLADDELTLAREERPFCLWAAAGGDFDEAVGLIPAAWSDAKKTLWRARLEAIRDNEHVRRIEQPVYKRRWDEQYKIGNRWECGQPAYDAEFLDAFDWWLSEKAEWWLEHPNKGKPVELDTWTKALWDDARVQAAWPVAVETRERLEAWKEERPVGEASAAYPVFTRYFRNLVKEQAVPDDIPYAVPWDELEKTRKIPAAVKRIRGKLNVPRERFRVNKAGLYVQAGL
jgi:hypothetical protein